MLVELAEFGAGRSGGGQPKTVNNTVLMSPVGGRPAEAEGAGLVMQQFEFERTDDAHEMHRRWMSSDYGEQQHMAAPLKYQSPPNVQGSVVNFTEKMPETPVTKRSLKRKIIQSQGNITVIPRNQIKFDPKIKKMS